MRTKELSHADVLRLFDYDEETGVMTNRIWRGNAAKGAPVGQPIEKGHLRVRIDRNTYQVHRLIWMYVHGRWPEGAIDHIDGNPGNNRISNLRDVPAAHNAQNRHRPHSNPPSPTMRG